MKHDYPMCLRCCDEASPAHDKRTDSGRLCLEAEQRARAEFKRMQETFNLPLT